jgi:hypothetical protein
MNKVSLFFTLNSRLQQRLAYLQRLLVLPLLALPPALELKHHRCFAFLEYLPQELVSSRL